MQSNTPVPYQLCACSICRKVGGYGGSVNLGGIAETLKISKGENLIKFVVTGAERFSAAYQIIRKYQAIKDRGTSQQSPCSSQRSFCSNCSSMLWLWDESWPELIHPFASAIDTELPAPDEMVCVLGESKPAWIRWPEGKKSVHQHYGNDSIEGWHKKHGMYCE